MHTLAYASILLYLSPHTLDSHTSTVTKTKGFGQGNTKVIIKVSRNLAFRVKRWDQVSLTSSGEPTRGRGGSLPGSSGLHS